MESYSLSDWISHQISELQIFYTCMENAKTSIKNVFNIYIIISGAIIATMGTAAPNLENATISFAIQIVLSILFPIISYCFAIIWLGDVKRVLRFSEYIFQRTTRINVAIKNSGLKDRYLWSWKDDLSKEVEAVINLSQQDPSCSNTSVISSLSKQEEKTLNKYRKCIRKNKLPYLINIGCYIGAALFSIISGYFFSFNEEVEKILLPEIHFIPLVAWLIVTILFLKSGLRLTRASILGGLNRMHDAILGTGKNQNTTSVKS